MATYPHCPEDCSGGQTEADCDGCEMNNPFYEVKGGRFGVGHVPYLVNAMLAYWDNQRRDDVNMLDMWDRIEIKDCIEEFPSLAKYVGKALEPHEKARVVITAVAHYWLRTDNKLVNVLTPLVNYPELSVPLEEIEGLPNAKRKAAPELPGGPARAIQVEKYVNHIGKGHIEIHIYGKGQTYYRIVVNGRVKRLTQDISDYRKQVAWFKTRQYARVFK